MICSAGAVEPRFLLDVNVAGLAKWLRALGYDAAACPGEDDDGLVRMGLAEGRILLTRDARLVRRRVVQRGALKALLVRDDRVRAQLRQVVLDLGLRMEERHFTRCLRCNTVLEPVSREAVLDRVPPYVLRRQDRFTTCPSCRRVYWPGTHLLNMRAELAGIEERAP